MPESPIDASQAEAVTATFAEYYGKQREAVQRGIDLVLDAVEDGVPDRTFTDKKGKEKSKFLRERVQERGKGFRGSHIDRTNLVLHAIELASAPFSTDVVRDPSSIFFMWSPSS